MTAIRRIIITDDISGENITGVEGAETIRFELDGISYEIDLGRDNARSFRRVFQPYIHRGRLIGTDSSSQPEPTSPPATGTSPDRGNIIYLPADNSTVRAWALNAGLPVGKRGRMTKAIRQAYEAARV